MVVCWSSLLVYFYSWLGYRPGLVSCCGCHLTCVYWWESFWLLFQFLSDSQHVATVWLFFVLLLFYCMDFSRSKGWMYKVLCLLQCSSWFSVVVNRNRDFVNFLQYFYQGLFGRGFESRLRRCDVIFWFSNFGVYQGCRLRLVGGSISSWFVRKSKKTVRNN